MLRNHPYQARRIICNSGARCVQVSAPQNSVVETQAEISSASSKVAPASAERMHIHLVFFTFNSPPPSRTVSAKSCAAIWSSSKDKSKPIMSSAYSTSATLMCRDA